MAEQEELILNSELISNCKEKDCSNLSDDIITGESCEDVDNNVSSEASFEKFSTVSDRPSCHVKLGDNERNNSGSEFDVTSSVDEIEDDENESQDLSDDLDAITTNMWAYERRRSGDGEENPETTVESKLDDDEDKMNPAYIPRKGSFFEHDLRNNDCGNVEIAQKVTKLNAVPTRSKWQHDRFDEKFQAPKSREEIVSVYGYDIRYENFERKSKKNRMDKILMGKLCNTNVMNANKHLRPRKSWPGDVLQIQNYHQNRSSRDSAMSVLDTAFADLHVQNVTASHSDISENAKVFTNQEKHSPNLKYNLSQRKTNKKIIKDNKPVKIGTGRVISKEHNVDSGNNSCRNGDQINTLKTNVMKKDGILSGRSSNFCTECIEAADFPCSSNTMILSAKNSQDARKLEGKDFCHTQFQNDYNPVYGSRNKVDSEKLGNRKSTIIVKSSMAPEIIPPVTRIQTNNKSVETKSTLSTGTKSKSSGIVLNDKDAEGPGYEFAPDFLTSKSDGKSKRYSTQRQKIVSSDTALTELNSHDCDEDCNSHIVADNNAVLESINLQPPSDQLTRQTAKYYVNTNMSSAHLRVYSVPSTCMHNKTIPFATGGASLVHAAYLNSHTMLPGAYLNPSVATFGASISPQFPIATTAISVRFPSEGWNSIEREAICGDNPEVRGGTMYFKPEFQQADVIHGTMYFNVERQKSGLKSPARRANAAIPIVNPEDLLKNDTNVLANNT